MNEPAIRTEEQIISLFPGRDTLVCQGWILKKMGGSLLVYLLYYKFSQGNIPDNIRKCEEISRQSGLDCMFRIVEHTNYYLSYILADNGYEVRGCGVVGEWNMTEDTGKLCVEGNSRHLKSVEDGENAEYVMTGSDKVIGIKRQRFLFLPDGNLSCEGLEDILRFGAADGITRILADIPGKEELPEQYERAGLSQSLSLPLLSERTGGLTMDLQNEKCVMVIDESLPLGIIANTAAIMGITIGKQMPEVVGADVYDRTGNGHLGIIEFPVPILKGNEDGIKAIREKLYEPEFSDLTVVDFSDLAQGCKTYDEFIEKMKGVSERSLNYLGIAICGAKKKVNKLTGSMALL